MSIKTYEVTDKIADIDDKFVNLVDGINNLDDALTHFGHTNEDLEDASLILDSLFLAIEKARVKANRLAEKLRDR